MGQFNSRGSLKLTHIAYRAEDRRKRGWDGSYRFYL